MTTCDTERCHRKAAFRVSAVAYIWDRDPPEALMCYPCWQVFKEGHKRHPAETTREIVDMEQLPEDFQERFTASDDAP